MVHRRTDGRECHGDGAETYSEGQFVEFDGHVVRTGGRDSTGKSGVHVLQLFWFSLLWFVE